MTEDIFSLTINKECGVILGADVDKATAEKLLPWREIVQVNFMNLQDTNNSSKKEPHKFMEMHKTLNLKPNYSDIFAW